jgi:F420-0:gamma-glutamyl ligase
MLWRWLLLWRITITVVARIVFGAAATAVPVVVVTGEGKRWACRHARPVALCVYLLDYLADFCT